jgi:hypothetical protein
VNVARFVPFARAALALPVLALAAVVACSGSDSPNGGDGGSSGQCVAYQLPSGTDLKNPQVSFALQVIPIFQKNCSYGSCHGSQQFPILGDFGGNDADVGTDPNAIKKNLVNVPSQIHKSMLIVKPGDPTNSFLMRTMDGDHCLLSADCKNNDCGAQMPNDRPVLSEEERMFVRRWIAQGAN